MSLLAVRQVSKRFVTRRNHGGTEALHDVSFGIEAGEFVSLLGPSGCGKSTVLRLIAGLLAPDQGEIVWSGASARKSGERREARNGFSSGRATPKKDARPELGFVFQEPTLMPWADALTNARLPLDLKAISRRQGDEQAAAALQRLGLAGFAQAFPRELSGGMKMRVSIARALAARPRVLLMDEPFAALDEPTRQALNDDLLALARQDGITVIFVTHSVMESAYLSDRVLVMSPRPGHIVADIALHPPAARGEDFRLSPQFADAQRRVARALLAPA
jgi:NitT/TauT family transport system ATP-binding protein